MSRVQTPFEYRASEVQRALEKQRAAEEAVAEAEAHLTQEREYLRSCQTELETQRAALFDEYPELLPPQTPTPGGSSSDWQPPGGGAVEFGEQDDTPPPDLEFRET